MRDVMLLLRGLEILSNSPGLFAHPSVVVHKYVGRLYISVTYAIAVDVLKSLGDLLHPWE